MAAPELYAPRRPDVGRNRAGSGARKTGSQRAGSAKAQGNASQARKRGLVYRALTTGVALSAVGGFGYYAWLAYSGERAPLPTDGAVLTIAAADTPIKVAPENPGGLTVEGSDLEFFNGVDGQRLTVRPDEEYVLPPPEAPITNPEPELFDRPPPVPTELAAGNADNDAAEFSVASASAEEQESAQPTAVAGVSVPPVLSAPMLPLPDLDPGEMTAQSAGATDQPAQATVAAAAAPQTVIDTLVASVDPALTAPSPQAVTQTDATPAATVQLASMRSRELAEREWQRLSRLMPDLLNNRQPIIRESTSNDRTYFRVSIAATGVVEAAALCAEIKNRSFDCIVHD